MRFSTLQRVEIAEISRRAARIDMHSRFSTLQRVEIAEMNRRRLECAVAIQFQYSSTSRNC